MRINSTNKVRELRQCIYEILRSNYPSKMSASEIANEINQLNMNIRKISTRQVSYAMRIYARMNRHFAIYKSKSRVHYSIYFLDPRYNAWDD